MSTKYFRMLCVCQALLLASCVPAATDKTAPIISAVAAGTITSSGAVITWTTDENSTSQVEYGTGTGYGSITALDSVLAKNHSVSLTGLSASTLYHYRVKSKDAADNEAVDTDRTFNTNSSGGGTTYTLTTAVNPASAGSVALNPSGGVYTAGTAVTLTATANSGYMFSSWSGNATGTGVTTTLTVSTNLSVTANFAAGTAYNLATAVSPAGGGSITLVPSGGTYASGTVVTLTAVSGYGYSFTSWTGDASGTSATTTLTMSANRSATAVFGAVTGGTVYFSDNFDSGNFSAWNGGITLDDAVNNSVTAESTIKRGSSGYSMKSVDNSATGSQAFVQQTLDIAGEAYFRFYVYFPSGYFTANGNTWKKISHLYSGNDDQFDMYSRNNGSNVLLIADDNNASYSSAVTEGVWHCIEFYCPQLNTSPITFRWWIDGTEQPNLSSTLFGIHAVSWHMWRLGNNSSGIATALQTLYYDDCVVKSTQVGL